MYRDQFGEFVCGYWGFKGKKRKQNKSSPDSIESSFTVEF